MSAAALVAILLALAGWLGQAPPHLRRLTREHPRPRPGRRVLAAAAAACAGPAWVGGMPGLVVGVLAAAAVWALGDGRLPAARPSAPPLPDLSTAVRLLGLALAAGAPTSSALRDVASGVGGATGDALGALADRLALGVPLAEFGARHGDDPALQRLVRALDRSSRSGAPVAALVAALADELVAEHRARCEERARAVGVRAAVPLGLCLLPAFLLLGIVPVVAATLSGLPW